jgi:hypothetical protein
VLKFQIRKTQKRRPPRRRSPDEIIARELAKRAVWAEAELYKLATNDEAVMLQVLSQHLGREIRPTTGEDKLKLQLTQKLLDLAIDKLENDPAFARRYLNAIMLQTLGMTAEDLNAYSDEGTVGREATVPKSAIKALTEQIQDFRRLREALGASDTGGGGIGKAIGEIMNSRVMVELVKLLPLAMSGHTSSPPEKLFSVVVNDQIVLMPESQYQEMARIGQAPPLANIEKIDHTSTSLAEYGTSGAPAPTEPAEEAGGIDQLDPQGSTNVEQSADDTTPSGQQLTDGIRQLLAGLGKDKINLAMHSEPNEFVDTLRKDIQVDPKSFEFLQLLTEMGSDVLLAQISGLQGDTEYGALVQHLISPEGRIWLKRVTEKAKDILKDEAQSTDETQ